MQGPTQSAERADSTREQALTDYRRVRAFSERLCEPLAVEDYLIQTVVQTSPPKWHLAHVSWFFETFLLAPYQTGYAAFHDGYDYLFNSYYEQLDSGFWPRSQRGLLSRPTVEEIYAYRRYIDNAMEALIQGCPEQDWPMVRNRLGIGLNHEQQHQELLVTDIKHNFAFNPLRPAYRADLSRSETGDPAPLTFTALEGGIIEIGAQGIGFAYDNELPRHKVYLEPYRLADRPVTNGEYLEFIEDGGYGQTALWLSDGWQTLLKEGWKTPLYWERLDGQWHEMTLGGLKPLNPAEPVAHVSFYEADAFATWAGKRLPAEAEWEQAAAGIPVAGNFIDDGLMHPRPAPDGEGLKQLFGDVWEWTASAYQPYPGYRAPEGALGEYNGKFMCNQMVLRGGSCATSADHARASYRNFFYPHERWQFKGFRLAESTR